LRQEVEEEEAVLLVYSARLEVDHGDGSLAAVVLGSVQNNKKSKGKGKASGGARRGKELGFAGDLLGIKKRKDGLARLA
jgi:hypothetical protein